VANDVQVRAYTPFGEPIGTYYPATAVKCAWARNQATAATFSIPKIGPRYASRYLRHLNRVEIHHAGLPLPWTGVLIQPEEKEATVDVTAQSSEYVLTRRFTDTLYTPIGTAGEIARGLLDQAGRQAPTGIALSALDVSGAQYYVEYEQKAVADALQELADRAGADWWIEKAGTDHRTPWAFRWAAPRGADRTAEVLLHGDICDPPSYLASGQNLVTALHVVGGGTGSGLSERLQLYIRDNVAIRLYGLVEDVLELSDVIDPVLLYQAGLATLLQRSRPAKTLGINLDNRRGMWGQFWLGDLIRVIVPKVAYIGLDAVVQVQGIQLDADAGKLGLVVEIVEVL
jgi:hypothetical protein